MNSAMEASPDPAARGASPWPRRASVILFWAGMALVLVGWATTAPWRGVAIEPTLTLLAAAALSVVLAWLLGRLLRCRFATALLAVWLLALVGCTGLASGTAVALIALAALALGSRFIPDDWPARAALSGLTGLALLVGVAGWTMPIHMHGIRVIYGVVLLLLVAWRWRPLCELLRPLPGQWSQAVAAAPLAAALAVLAVGVASTSTWLPTILFDDLSYHIGLPAQLASLGYYQMNAGSNVWAVAPWAADVLHGIAWVLAGVESRGPVNALWFALAVILLWRLCEALELRPGLRWLAVALLASAPELAYTLASMQTEGPTIAVMFGIALLIQRCEPDRRALMVVGILFGLLVGLKVSNLWFALPLGLWLLWRWRLRLPWRVLPLAVLLALVVAGSSYVYAWVLTGNPVLPVFNGIFHSPFYPPTNYYDSRWHSGFGWNIVWNVVFHSGKYIEGGDSAGAFYLIGLAGCFGVALARPKSRALALAAAVAFLLPLAVIQYLRYATPGMALLIPAMLCGVPVAAGSVTAQRRARMVVMWLLVPLAFVFVSSVCWQFKYGVVPTWLAKGDAGVFDQFAPSRTIAQVIRQRYGSDARTLMLVPDQPFTAELAGRGFSDVWYDPRLFAVLRGPNPPGAVSKWQQAIRLTGANLVITRGDAIPPGVQDAIVANRATLAYAAGGLDLWQLHAGTAGMARPAAGHGIAVTFDTADAPPGPTLVHGELTLACNPALAAHGHIVVGWQVREAGGRPASHYGWAQCQPDGEAQATFDVAVRKPVTAFTALVQPDNGADMGLGVLASRGSLRVDRTAANDLARVLRHKLRFRHHHPPRVPGGAA